jgi:phospholipase C
MSSFDRAIVAPRVEAAVSRVVARMRHLSARSDPSAFGGSPPPNPDLPVGTDTLPQIRHIVVLMMENHSFDNYLGMLGRGDGFSLDEDGAPLNSNPTRSGASVRAAHLGTTRQPMGVPTQSWEASHEQWSKGSNDGFVRSAELASEKLRTSVDPAVAMGYWTKDDLPF